MWLGIGGGAAAALLIVVVVVVLLAFPGTNPDKTSNLGENRDKPGPADKANGLAKQPPGLLKLRATIPAHDGPKGHGPRNLALTPDGKTAVTVGYDGAADIVQVWNLSTQQVTASYPERLSSHLSDAATTSALTISPDGKWVAYARFDKDVVVRSAATGAVRHKLYHKGFLGRVNRLIFSPKGDLLIAATTSISKTSDGEILGWNLETGAQQFIWKGDRFDVTALVMFKDGQRLASGGGEGEILIWDLAQGKPVQTFAKHKNKITQLAVSGDGKYLAGGGVGQDPIQIWDIPANKTLRASGGTGMNANSLAFLADNKTLLYLNDHGGGSAPSPLHFWNVATGLDKKIPHGFTSGCSALVLSADGSTLAAALQNRPEKGERAIAVWAVNP